jgi:hypothetical protein
MGMRGLVTALRRGLGTPVDRRVLVVTTLDRGLTASRSTVLAVPTLAWVEPAGGTAAYLWNGSIWN